MYKNYIFLTFVLYLILAALIYLTKPKLMFDKNKLRNFGTKKNQTVFPFWMALLVAGILSYIISIVIFMKFL